MQIDEKVVTMPTATAAQAAMRAAGRPDRVTSTERFFKAYPGGYSHGDKFLAVGVPATRSIAKEYKNLPLPEVATLLASEWHDERLLALIIMVERYKRADPAEQQVIYNFYMQHIRQVNNWDLVDSSAEFIVGPYLEQRADKLVVLQHLAGSDWLWERRIAMLATFDYIKKGSADTALTIIEQLLHDQHDLIQKAVGWMLREIGKRVSRNTLVQFLDEHAATMPRITLRYAIEHLEPAQKQHYLALKTLRKTR
jgi:3-methyladenine DNA glycosylase AlkD